MEKFFLTYFSVIKKLKSVIDQSIDNLKNEEKEYNFDENSKIYFNIKNKYVKYWYLKKHYIDFINNNYKGDLEQKEWNYDYDEIGNARDDDVNGYPTIYQTDNIYIPSIKQFTSPSHFSIKNILTYKLINDEKILIYKNYLYCLNRFSQEDPTHVLYKGDFIPYTDKFEDYEFKYNLSRPVKIINKGIIRKENFIKFTKIENESFSFKDKFKNYKEDYYYVCDSYFYFIDGHSAGNNNELCSLYVKDINNMLDYLCRNKSCETGEDTIRYYFYKIQKYTNILYTYFVGGCLLLGIIFNNKIHISYVGDIGFKIDNNELIYEDNNSEFLKKMLNAFFDDVDIKNRVINQGGEDQGSLYKNLKYLSDLSNINCTGDFGEYAICYPIPINIQNKIVICSDGLYDGASMRDFIEPGNKLYFTDFYRLSCANMVKLSEMKGDFLKKNLIKLKEEINGKGKKYKILENNKNILCDYLFNLYNKIDENLKYFLEKDLMTDLGEFVFDENESIENKESKEKKFTEKENAEYLYSYYDDVSQLSIKVEEKPNKNFIA